MQHFTLQDIFTHQSALEINFNNVIIVRNPYHKVLSGLFHKRLIKPESSQPDVFIAIKKYLTLLNIDNHNKPQHTFLTINGVLHPDVIILKTESLQQDLQNHGFGTLNFNQNVNKNHKDYLCYLNQDSIDLINVYYDLDFTYFGYEKIN